jgi:hypothetical protein
MVVTGCGSETGRCSTNFIPQGFGWSPDGQQLALVRGKFVYVLEPGGVERPLAAMSRTIVTATRYSRDGGWVHFSLSPPDGPTSSQPEGLYRVRTDGTGSNTSDRRPGLLPGAVARRLERRVRELSVAMRRRHVYPRTRSRHKPGLRLWHAGFPRARRAGRLVADGGPHCL